MSDDELIDVLRRMSPRLDMLDCENVLTAADRLEAQAAEIERLGKACAEWAEVSQSNYQRAKAAEAKLAKAVEALHQIAGKKDFADDPWDIARAALAELKGDKP